MNEIKVTIELAPSPELVALLKPTNGAGGITQAATHAQPTTPPIQAQPIQAAQTAPPAQAQPAQAPQQVVPPAQPAPQPVPQPPVTAAAPVTQPAQPTYTVEMLANAAAAIADTKRQELVNLLAQFGADSLHSLAPEHYGAFATALRGLGAVI